MKNKKAQIGKILIWIVAALIIFFILFIFLILSNIAFTLKFQKQGEVAKLINGDQAQFSLKNLLKSEAEVELDGIKQTIHISDLIRIYYYNESYENILIEESEKALEKFSGCYLLSLKDLEIGNYNLHPDNSYAIKLPISSEDSLEIILNLDNKCLNQKNEK